MPSMLKGTYFLLIWSIKNVVDVLCFGWKILRKIDFQWLLYYGTSITRGRRIGLFVFGSAFNIPGTCAARIPRLLFFQNVSNL